MKYTPRWKQILFAILHPSYHITVGRYSKARDRKVQRLIAEHTFKYSWHVSSSGIPFSVTFDTGDVMWIESTNFASGKMLKKGTKYEYDDFIPSRHTMYLIKKNIVDKYEEQ